MKQIILDICGSTNKLVSLIEQIDLNKTKIDKHPEAKIVIRYAHNPGEKIGRYDLINVVDDGEGGFNLVEGDGRCLYHDQGLWHSNIQGETKADAMLANAKYLVYVISGKELGRHSRFLDVNGVEDIDPLYGKYNPASKYYWLVECDKSTGLSEQDYIDIWTSLHPDWHTWSWVDPDTYQKGPTPFQPELIGETYYGRLKIDVTWGIITGWDWQTKTITSKVYNERTPSFKIEKVAVSNPGWRILK